MMRALESALGPERTARLRARLEALEPHVRAAREFAAGLSAREWAGIAAALLVTMFTWQLTRMQARQTRLLERQTSLLEAQSEQAASERATARLLARARLRSTLWRVQDILNPTALKEAAALPPDRRGAAVAQARQLLEQEESNPALGDDAEMGRAWRSALGAARLAEETGSQAGADPGFFVMQAERVRRDLMTAGERIAALESAQ